MVYVNRDNNLSGLKVRALSSTPLATPERTQLPKDTPSIAPKYAVGTRYLP